MKKKKKKTKEFLLSQRNSSMYETTKQQFCLVQTESRKMKEEVWTIVSKTQEGLDQARELVHTTGTTGTNTPNRQCCSKVPFFYHKNIYF